MKISTLIVSLSLLVFFSSGCSMIGLNENPLTIEQKATLVQSAARTGTYFALTEVYKDDRAKMLEKATFIKNHISAFSVSSPVTPEKVYAAFLAHVPPQYALLMQNALDVFSLYFTVDLEGNAILTEENLSLITAFCVGVTEGCDIVLQSS